MSEEKHIHTDDIIVDADVHFTINTTTRIISNQNGEHVNKKLSLIQYDNNSERYSFDIPRKIDNHDLKLCNRVTVHFINVGSGRGQSNPGVYIVPINEIREHETDPEQLTFTWLISNEATMYSGVLKFLISFECIDGDKILYRWSTTTFDQIQIVPGMKNGDEVMEVYSDELLTWQNNMEFDVIPQLVDDCYIERDFATSEEVMLVLGVTNPPDLLEKVYIDMTPTQGSSNLVRSGGVKTYVDDAITALEARISALEQS